MSSVGNKSSGGVGWRTRGLEFTIIATVSSFIVIVVIILREVWP